METALSNMLHRDVDLVIFGQSSPLLRHQILKFDLEFALNWVSFPIFL